MPFTVHIACTVHQTVISIEHLVIASASFFRFAVQRKKLLYMVKLKGIIALYLKISNTQNCIVFKMAGPGLFLIFLKFCKFQP